MRKCKQCKAEIPTAAKSETVHHKKRFCSVDCMVKWGLEQAKTKRINDSKKKKEREFKEMKERVESQGAKSKLKVRAIAAFDAFIRYRDRDKPCISCGTTKVVNGGYRGAGGWDAGHYRSRGANPELTFNEDNCFKQCVNCNRDKSGNAVNMRIEILKRIGQKRLDLVEGPHDAKHYTADDLREIAKEYKLKLKELQISVDDV